MKPRQTIRHAAFSAAALFLLSAAGCVTMQNREDEVRQQEQQRALQQGIDRLKAQTESLLAQQDQLQQQMQQMRAAPQDRVTSSEFQQLQSQMQSRLADMERRIAAVDAAREQDKKEIVERLSKNVSAAMAQMSRPSTPTRSTAGGSKTGASTAKPSGPQKMYEHTVAAGDTLSAIASAYHASASSIIAANNLKDPGHLKVGQKLLIPAP